MRGLGGVFYDHLKVENPEDAERLFTFQQANGTHFRAYLPLVEKEKALLILLKIKHGRK